MIPRPDRLSAASPLLVRLGGLAALVGGVAWVALLSPGNLVARILRPFGLLRENIFSADNIVFVVLVLGAAAGVAALHALQRRRNGRVSTVAAFVSLAGLLMLAVGMVVGYGAEGLDAAPVLAFLDFLFASGLLLSSVGLTALGIATIRTGVLPWWCGAALIAGSPAAGIGLSTFMWIAGDTALSPVVIAWMLVGYAVLRAATPPASATSG